MPEILAIQMSALLVAMLSINAADFVCLSGRIAKPFHSLWVASSIVAMCLPVLNWMGGVFIGPGAAAWSIVGAIETGLFFGLYRNLLNLPTIGKLGRGLPLPAERSQPPATR